MALKLNSNFLRFYGVAGRLPQISLIKWNSTSVNFLNYDKDPAPAFFNQDTQKLLKSITQLHLEKVFRKRTVKDNHPEYKFLTTKQLEEEVRKRYQYAQKSLQMPPVVQVMKDNCKILSKDPALIGLTPYTYVFTDITFGLENNDRLCVIRKPDGTLQEAPYEIKKRACQIYFPIPKRSLTELALFQDDNLKRLMNEKEYKYILDRACCQFEPFEQRFHDITSKVYLHINDNLHFDVLRSTRHFGPMAFFLAWHKIIDDLLLDMIRNDYLKNGVELIVLMYKLNEIKESTDIIDKLYTGDELEKQIKKTFTSLLNREETNSNRLVKSEEDLRVDEMCFEFIQNFVSKYSLKKPQLELTLQTYKEWHNEVKNAAMQTN